MSIEWDINLGFEELAADIEARIPIALARSGEFIRGEAVALTPLEIGDLRGSAGVVVRGHVATVEYHSVYARYQHYGLDFHHPRAGQALFLEQPMVTKVPEVAQIFQETIWGD